MVTEGRALVSCSSIQGYILTGHCSLSEEEVSHVEEKQILKQITLFLSFLFEEPMKYRKYKKYTNSCNSRGVTRRTNTALQCDSLQRDHLQSVRGSAGRQAGSLSHLKAKESGSPGVGPGNLPF